jgi:hypothetical protein
LGEDELKQLGFDVALDPAEWLAQLPPERLDHDRLDLDEIARGFEL